MKPGVSKVLFFDGDCVFCHGSVRWVSERDKDQIYYYSSLQGTTAAECLPEELRKNLSTVVLWSNGVVFLRSRAAFETLRGLGGGYTILAQVLSLLPYWFSDFFYSIVAKIRYRIFGKFTDTCDLPSREIRSRMLP